MKFMTAVLVLMGLTQTNIALADNSPTLIPVAVNKVYVPEGFDDNDNIQIVGEGMFANSCYRPAESDATVDMTKKEIILNPKAFKYNGFCLQVMLPFQMPFHFGPLSAGTYNIKQDSAGPVLGVVNVHKSATSEPDDYLYAPVSQAFLAVNDGSAQAIITGDFPSSCMKIKEVKYEVQPNVIVIQPIAEMDSSANCTNGNFPFSTTTDFGTLKAGKYLLHIRSMNGKSVNSLVNVQ